MHENRHFLSYRKRRHDAENHVHLYALRHSGETLQNGSSHRVADLETIPVRISKDEDPTPLPVVGPFVFEVISAVLFLSFGVSCLLA